MSNYDPITKAVLDWFTQISQIPHKSKQEEKIRAWLIDWAKERSFDVKEDAAGNVLIKVPGTKGYENSPIVVLQGHMDMVCEKTPESTINFDTDPLELVYDGDWLKANGTTLGADNGIAVAIAFAAVEDPKLLHGPLEIILTVDEETGLTGANALEPGFLDGKILLNLDSEDNDVLEFTYEPPCYGVVLINDQKTLIHPHEYMYSDDIYMSKLECSEQSRIEYATTTFKHHD